MPSRLRIAVLVLAAVVLFLSFLGRRDIVTSHEARVAQTARLMAASGWPWNARPVSVKRPGSDQPWQVNPWAIPVFGGEIRLQKPPLPYWCTAVVFRAFGTSEGAARAVPALMGVFGTMLLYALGKRLYGRRVAFAGACIWITTHFIVDEYRKAMADPYLAFFALACIWAWIAAAQDRRGVYLLAFYVSLALALLAKGPPALVVIALPLLAFHLLYRRMPLASVPAHLAGVALLLAIGLPWPIYLLSHIPDAIEIWRYESLGELADNVENARPWYFYPPNLLLIALPWTPWWILGLLDPFSRDRRPQRWLPLFWLAAVVLFFSFVHQKKNAYLLPAVPAVVLMVAQMTVIPRRSADRWLVGQAVAYGAALLVFVNLYDASKDNARSPRPIGRHITALLAADRYAVAAPDALWFYLPLEVPDSRSATRTLVAVEPGRRLPPRYAAGAVEIKQAGFNGWRLYEAIAPPRHPPAPAPAPASRATDPAPTARGTPAGGFSSSGWPAGHGNS